MEDRYIYVLHKSCRPCNFICDICKNLIYRCTIGIDMYIKESTNSCICETCYEYISID
jgi:hypothetical protein